MILFILVNTRKDFLRFNYINISENHYTLLFLLILLINREILYQKWWICNFFFFFLYNSINISKSLILLINCPIFSTLLTQYYKYAFLCYDIFLYNKFNESYKNLIRLKGFIIKQIHKELTFYLFDRHMDVWVI